MGHSSAARRQHYTHPQAQAYQSAGQLAEALPLFEQTLELMKAKLGPEHPSTLASMNNLALAYQSAGRLAEALPLHEQTLKLTKASIVRAVSGRAVESNRRV